MSKTLTVLALVLVGGLGYVSAATINVPADQPTISAAVAAASAGDVIVVAPGTYSENVTVNKSLTIRSSGGKGVTTVTGSGLGGDLGTFLIAADNVTLGSFGQGFTINGYDSANPGIEYAAVYVQGVRNNITIRGNQIVANGEGALVTEFGNIVTNLVVNANMFSGKTFTGAEAGDCGFANQFTAANVPRQLVVIPTGSGITFTSNMLTGTAGSASTFTGCTTFGQGNTLTTIDASNVTISGNTFSGTTARFGSHLRVRGVNVSIYCNTFDNAGLGLASTHIVFNGTLTALSGGASPSTIAGVATVNTFTTEGAYFTGATQIYRSSAQVLAISQVPITANTTVLANVTNTNTGISYCSIQSAIDDANTLNGHTITVAAGTYNEDVLINKQLTLIGAGYASTVVSGPIGGQNVTMFVQAGGVVIDGFGITRDGNNVTDWNNAGLNSAGIAVQSQGNYAEVRNCSLYGNRTGIDINNSNGCNIHNNIIDNNRTGMIFRNQTDNTVVVENKITNNWTVGILFLDASGGTNSPVQSAASSMFKQNSISGNWYGQVVDRQSGGSLPTPGTTNLKNFKCNWYGTLTPVVTTANSAEPGYAGQIPVVFGGSAVLPGGQPDIAGPASANIIYQPFLSLGTDSDLAQIGFQPAPNSCSGGTPKLSATINTVVVNANNDGIDDLGAFAVCPATNNILFGPFTDQGGLVDPLLKVYQTFTVTNVSVPFCNNCSAPMSAFNGTTGTAALLDPTQSGTLVMRFRSWIDTDNSNSVNNGELASDWIQYTITVNPKPINSCPSNIAATVVPGDCNAVATYIVGVSTSPAATVTYSFSGATTGSGSGTGSGSAFGNGTTIVTVTASNVCGTETCVFNVVATGNQTPAITCPANIIRNADAGVCTAVVTFANATATDNCPNPTVMQSGGPVSGSIFPKGPTTVTFKATDGAGLMAFCTFTVTVLDTQAPTIACPANMSVGNTTNQCSAIVTYATPTAADNCALAAGSPSLQSGPASGGTFPKGQTTVVWLATDQAGLTKTCSFRITVNDTQAPTITCPGSQSIATSPGSCSSVGVTYATPTAMDNCTPAPTVARIGGPISGSTFPAGTTNVTWRAIDGSGRSATCSFSVTVTDNQPPTITCPQNIVQNNPPNACNTPVTYATPTATDNCGLSAVYLLSGLGSSSVFPPGTTTNVWQAVDNNGASTTCAFTVTVNCGVAKPGDGNTQASPGAQGSRASKIWKDSEPEAVFNLSLAPNPAATQVRFKVSGLGEKSGELLVFDGLGRMVMRQELAPEQNDGTFEVSDLPEGLYRVSLRTEQQVVMKGLVVNKR